MVIRRSALLGTIVLTVVWAAQMARAQSAPVVDLPAPITLERGQSLSINLTGKNLSALALAPVIDARGVSVALLKAAKPDPAHLGLKITASPEAALGDRSFRLVGSRGVSNPIHLFISQYPVITAREPDNHPMAPRQIKLPATLVGRLDVAGDVDQFRFDAKQGEQLIFDLYADRLGSPLEALAVIDDAGGREMRPTVEHRSGDPVLIFQVPRDGSYRLRVRDLEYRGGADYDYRIVAGRIPYVEAILPSSGRPGTVVVATPSGYNLEGAEKMTIDLSASPPGRVEVRAKTPLGYSNPAPFEVTELPQAVEAEPNDSPAHANAVRLPVEVGGHIDQPGDEDFFKFHLAYRQLVSLEVLARRYGSAVTPLLQLWNAQGGVMQRNDGVPDADARIVADLAAGDYFASVSDLTRAGGPGYWYRLKIEPASALTQDFSAHFFPDAPRLHRGGNVAMWCEVDRRNGFTGDVTLAPVGLPAGVTAGPIVLGPDASGWFTLSASADAALGAVPIRLVASAKIGAATVSHDAQATNGRQNVEEAYLTVLDPAPFAVEAVAMITPQRLQQMSGEMESLAAKMNGPDPQFDAALAQWEKKAADQPKWQVLTPASAVSEKGGSLAIDPDGSVRMTGTAPGQDRYTIVAHTKLKGITAVRLDALADSRLPGGGPGAAPNGNFVLTEFKMFAAKDIPPAASQPVSAPATGSKDAPKETSKNATTEAPKDGPKGAPKDGAKEAPKETPKDAPKGPPKEAASSQTPPTKPASTTLAAAAPRPMPIGLKNAWADFAQDGFPTAGAIDGNPATGWAVAPQYGRSHFAAFETTAPVGFDSGTTLTFVLEHESGFAQHLLGRFRLSITTADPKLLQNSGPTMPATVASILAEPADGWSVAQKKALANYFRTIDPDTAAERARLEAMRSFVEPYAQANRLAEVLRVETPQLGREQAAWEKAMAAGAGWSVLPITGAVSTAGADLETQPDGSVFADGLSPAQDTYELTGSTPIKQITAVRVEVLPDARLPGDGPGRAKDGNFVLTHFAVKSPPAKNQPARDVELASATASVEQDKYSIASALSAKDPSGWAIAPDTGRPAEATFYPSHPIARGPLTIVLEQRSKLPRHTIGRVRIWITSNPQPQAALRPPERIVAILKKTKGRSREQIVELSSYFRSIAPSLDPVRQRLADLQSQAPAMPLKFAPNRAGAIPVPIDRRDNFQGEIQVSLIGFAKGRLGDEPAPITQDLSLNPMTVSGDKMFGTLTFMPLRGEETGARMVVLKAEAKVGAETIVEYSPAFPLTIGK